MPVDTSIVRGGPLAGRTTKNVAGAANVTLTGDDIRNERILCTGALTGSISVIFPLGAESEGKSWHVSNRTTGAFKLGIVGPSGTALDIPQGAALEVMWDGSAFGLAGRDVRRRYILVDPSHTPVATENDGTAASGTGGATNVMILDGVGFEYFILGTQTLLIPTIAAGGLLASLDLTDNDGVIYSNGITSRSKMAFTIGTDQAFFCKVKFTLNDVSGTDDCAVGFVKTQAYAANFDDYTDAAVLNVILGDIFIETILNNAATTSTDTTNNWADTETHELAVYVSAAGVVTYKIDGAAPVTVAAFTFDGTDVVVPIFYFLQATTSPTTMHILSWQCGFQAEEV